MSIDPIRQAMPDYAKDTKLNLGKIFSEDGAPGLSEVQAAGTALASAYATKQPELIKAVAAQVAEHLSEADVTAAKAAATIMGMNNVYYRFVHLASDKEFGRMPANLRMNVIGNPGVEKVDFELMSLAVSAINGCGMCIDAHVSEVSKAGVNREGIQSAIRIASVLAAAAQALVIEANEGNVVDLQAVA